MKFHRKLRGSITDLSGQGGYREVKFLKIALIHSDVNYISGSFRISEFMDNMAFSLSQYWNNTLYTTTLIFMPYRVE
jgi:hypothetical protein